MKNARWTPEETERLLQMRADGASFEGIAEAFKRTVKSVEGRFYWLTMSPLQREKRLQNKRGYHGTVESRVAWRPPLEVLVERDAVASVEPTLGMRYLGDPLPGRSALDRMQQGKS